MRQGGAVTQLVAAVLMLAALATAAVARQRAWSPPRTPWGDPDLRGVWPLD